jgi:hypothetical protein
VRRWVSAALLLWASLLAACSTVVTLPQQTEAAPTSAQAEAAWARVLERFVNARGEVAFSSLAKDRADLDLVVRHVAAAPLAGATPEAQLAHMINAYNALSMFNVVESGIPATHDGWAKVRFFVLRRFVIGGQAMSLYHFENEVIRPLARRAGEPRIHFALNCSARSCPQLPRRPFTAAQLRDELERETRAFFARADVYAIDDTSRTVRLSSLLAFYPEDFVPAAAPTLAAYAARYAPRAAPADYAVEFLRYDWTIANSEAAVRER